MAKFLNHGSMFMSLGNVSKIIMEKSEDLFEAQVSLSLINTLMAVHAHILRTTFILKNLLHKRKLCLANS